MFRIMHKRQLSDAVFEMGVEAPAVARKARAGQFLILRVDETGERIPLTFSDWSAEEGWVRFIFMRVGATTQLLLPVGSSAEPDSCSHCATACLAAGRPGAAGLAVFAPPATRYSPVLRIEVSHGTPSGEKSAGAWAP